MIGYSGGGVTRRGILGGTLGAGLVAIFNGDALALEAAEDEATPPYVHTRAQWGARAPLRRAEVLDSPPDRIVVHHTATPNSKDYSVAHAYRLSRQIQRSHMRTRGWDDIGEQLTISRGGHIMEGRNRSLSAILSGKHVVGAQARHHNSHTIGIENEGTYAKAAVPQSLWESLVAVCTWLCEVYELDPVEAIAGHRDLCETSCPGEALYSRLPELRLAIAERLAGPGPRPAVRPRHRDAAAEKRRPPAAHDRPPSPRRPVEPTTARPSPDNPSGRPRP